MKKTIAMIIFLAMMILASIAQAENYTVKKGDYLSKIAKQFGTTWPKLYQANTDKIKNPNLIYPNQVLTIPEFQQKETPAQTVKTVAEEKPFYWKKPAANPFGSRDFTKVIKMFSLPDAVQEALIAKVKSGDYEWNQITVGYHFEQMVFGNYKVVNNVIAQFEPNCIVTGKSYLAEYDGKIYYLTDPLICHNWCWWSEPKPQPPPPPPPPPTGACCLKDGSCLVVRQDKCEEQGGSYCGNGTTCEPNPCPQPPPPPPPTGACCLKDGTCLVVNEAECAEKAGTYCGDGTTCEPNPCPQPPPPPPEVKAEEPKEELPLLLIPPEAEPAKPVVAEPVVQAPEKKGGFDLENETYAWAGHYWPLQGHGYSNYYGGKTNEFFYKHETPWGMMREGIGATINGWDGRSNGFDYAGYRWSLGPVLDLTNSQGTRYVGTVQIGQQTDRGHDNLGYKAKQKTDIMYFGLSNDIYNVGPIKKIESWADFVLDIGHNKESQWQKWQIPEKNDPAGDKTAVGLGSRLYLWDASWAKGGLLLKGSYAWEDSSIGSSLGPFIADKQDLAKLGVEWHNISNSKYDNANGNSIGVGIDLDITKILKKIGQYLKTKKSDKEEVKKE